MTAITGISDEQLKTLTKGGWKDDATNSPGWRRRVLVVDKIGEQRVLQWIWLRGGDVWHAEISPDSEMLIDNLDEALKLCDDWAEGREIAVSDGSATRQERRFAWWATVSP